MTDSPTPWLLAALGWAILAGLAYRRWGWTGALAVLVPPLALLALLPRLRRPREEPTRPQPTTLPPDWERLRRDKADDLRREAEARRDALPQSDDSEEAIVQRMTDRATGGRYIVHEVVQDGPDDA